MNALPEKVVEVFRPGMKSVNHYNHVCVLYIHGCGCILTGKQEMSSQIAEILAIKAQGKTREADRNTVFAALLDSDLPPEDKTLRRLHHEAFTVIGAGFDTTRFAMTVASYHILSTPSVYHRLREELKAAIPDPTNMPPLQELEKLPYLTGCIQEGMCPYLPLCSLSLYPR